MSPKFLSLIAGVSALALAGASQAAEPAHAAAPMQLSVAQMDSVTAAGGARIHELKLHSKWWSCKTPCGKPPVKVPAKGSAKATADAIATADAPANYDVKTDAVAATDTTVTATTVSATSVASAKSVAKPAH